MKTGYIDCACRDCFEIAIGPVGAMCAECGEAGCDAFYTECRRSDAYDTAEANPNPCLGCGAERIVNVNGTHTEKGAWCSPELSVGIRRYEERIAALGGYGVRVRAVGAVDGAPREGRLIELGFGGCQPGVETDDGRRYLIRLESLERASERRRV